MHQDSGKQSARHKRGTPEERVLHWALKWRELDAAFAADKKNHLAGTAEYRARQELRQAIDELPRSSSKPD